MDISYSFRPYHGPGFDSAPSENEYQENFLGVKAACAWGWQPHHLQVLNVMEYGSLNLLEPSGPHRACYGTALPLYHDSTRLYEKFSICKGSFLYGSHKGVWGRIPVLNFCTTWRWMVCLTLRPLYPRESNLSYLLNREVGGPQSRYCHFEDKENVLTPPGTELSFLERLQYVRLS